jgi:pyruvate formate lyase activating enzyme
LRVARFWEKSRDTVTCLVCERRCRIPEGGRGVCGNYVNIGGTLYHYDYGRLSAVESDPLPASPGGSKASPERFVGSPLGSALLIY